MSDVSVRVVPAIRYLMKCLNCANWTRMVQPVYPEAWSADDEDPFRTSEKNTIRASLSPKDQTCSACGKSEAIWKDSEKTAQIEVSDR